MDDLFDMVDINVANELSFERMKTQCLPINSKRLFMNKDVLKKNLDWLIDMRRKLYELLQSDNVDIQ